MEKSLLLAQVKAILKSLVLSSPDAVTVQKLSKEYREIEGEFIPYQRLGFRSLDEFLRSIPETLIIQGTGSMARVYFVNSSKSKHIHDMIMRQKKSNTKSAFSPAAREQRQNNSIETCVLMQQRLPVGQQLSPFQSVKRNVAVRVPTLRQYEVAPLHMPQLSTSSNIDLNDNRKPQGFNRQLNNGNVKDVKNGKPRTSECLPKRNATTSHCQTQHSDIHLQTTKTRNSAILALQNGDRSQTQLLHDTMNICTPKKDEIPRLLADNNAKEQSRKLTGTESSIGASDQEHIKQLQRLLSTSCHVTAPTRKNVRFSVNPRQAKEASPKTTKNSQADNHTVLDESASKVQEFKKLLDASDRNAKDMDDAIPAFAADSKVFRVDSPAYSVPHGYKIPVSSLPQSFKVNDCIPIFIAEIHSPYKFWFHMHKENHELDILMYQIERFYSSLQDEELRIPIACLNPGQICAAIFNDMWHRAEICATPINNTVKVCFLDYGTVTEVSVDDIKYLYHRFANLPIQALRGCLSHIQPKGLHWSHEATMHFLSGVAEKVLYAKISEIDRENLITYMVICDTNGQILQINKDLVMRGFAIFNEDWNEKAIAQNNGRRKLHPRECYPTFSMIESGEYPTFTEIVQLLQCNIDYDAIYDRILFNKSCVLNFEECVSNPMKKFPFFMQTSNPFRMDLFY